MKVAFTNSNSFLAFLIVRLLTNATKSRRPNAKYLSTLEKRLIGRIDRIFKKQMGWVLEELKSFGSYKENSHSFNGLEDDAEKFVDGLPFKADLVEEIIAMMEVSMLKGGKTSVKNLKLGEFGI